MKNLNVNQNICGFTVTAAKKVDEINATLYTLTHSSGAVLYYIGKDDSNKVFGVSFTTPPTDDTGVFHIIEHSVLCGSEKYPVREPFVNLLKTSMNTFLNAITYPDRTVYPVASTSEKDLTNLMSVYLDAVFRPRMIEDERIFMQEGWHYDFSGGKTGISGVVYSEMKGAMSPDRVSEETLYKALFPTSPYGKNSGGDPDAIPSLTYEKFVAVYKKHYNAANAIFYLYGDLDLEAKLTMIVSYLSPGGEKITIPKQPQVSGRMTADYDCGQEKTENNAYITLGCAPLAFEETEKLMALGLIDDALCGSNTSPLKKAVLGSGIAVDFESGLDINMAQPVYKLKISKTCPDCEAEFSSIVENTVKKLIEKGLPANELEASLASLEFSLKEDDSGSRPKGLYYFLRILSSVTYGSAPDKWLAYGRTLTFLKSKLGTGWYEELAREVYFGVEHKAVVIANPVQGLTAVNDKKLDEELAARFDAMPGETKALLKTKSEDFAAFQNTPDSPEALATLPVLTLADLMQPPKSITTDVTENGGINVLCRTADTNQITYVQMYFDIGGLSEEDLPYAAVLSSVLDELPTKNKSSSKIKRLIKQHLGEWSANVRVFSRPGDEYTPLFTVGYSALPENLLLAAGLTNEVLTEKLFDKKAIMTTLKQDIEDMKQVLRSGGHATAMRRLRANLTKSGRVSELLGGVELYAALKKAVKEPDALIEKLAAVAEKIFIKNKLTVSLTGNNENAKAVIDTIKLPENDTHPAPDILPEKLNEAFEAPGSVNYTAFGGNLADIGENYDSRLSVVAKVLDYDYLWNEVRAKGGAYGVGLLATRSGDLIFYSYRDPNLKATIDAFARAGDYLEKTEITQVELNGYIISIIADIDKPVSPRLAGLNADAEYFSDVTESYKQEVRNRILSTSPADIKSFAPMFKKTASNGRICAVGSKAKLKEIQFDRITKL